jgi:hypothetical protein
MTHETVTGCLAISEAIVFRAVRFASGPRIEMRCHRLECHLAQPPATWTNCAAAQSASTPIATTTA